jgi:large conductance mechanosensitive channel
LGPLPWLLRWRLRALVVTVLLTTAAGVLYAGSGTPDPAGCVASRGVSVTPEPGPPVLPRPPPGGCGFPPTIVERAMLKGFRDFILRGNVIDLAVGIVIGAAFGTVVNQFVASFLTPIVRLAGGGKPTSGVWHLTDDVTIDWSAFLNAVFSFLLVAAAVYFVVVMPVNKLNQMRRRGEEPAPEAVSEEVRLLTEIRDALRERTEVAPRQREEAPPVR